MRWMTSAVAWWMLLCCHAVLALECQTSASQGQPQVIPDEWINDGYCDCPFDGADETETNACAGSDSWPGIAANSQASRPLFVCPEQPNLQLPLSRIRDGICDCCDGADETPGACPDICEEVLREEREARERLQKAFAVGNNKRKHELFAFKQKRQEKLKELEDLEAKVEGMEESVLKVDEEIATLKQTYASSRRLVASQLPAIDLLTGLTLDELRSLLIHVCQVAGEIVGETSSENTCVPLRLAALDLGWFWGEDNYETGVTPQKKEEPSMSLADRLFSNAAHSDNMYLLNDEKDASSRRLDEVADDHYIDHDDYVGHYDHDDDGYPPDDDLYMHGTSDSQASEIEGKEKEYLDSVQSRPFSNVRNIFLGRTLEIADQISQLLDEQAKTEESNEETGETDNVEDNEPTHDPVSYAMTKSNLKRKQDAIQKGFRWGASAQLFLDAQLSLPDVEYMQLAIETIFFGDLRAVDVWQVLTSVVSGLSENVETNEESCVSPWAAICPPKSIQRDSVTIPTSVLKTAAEEFCTESTSRSAMEELCVAPETTEGDMPTVPTDIPDGFYGYFSPVQRSSSDSISLIFEPLKSLPVDKDGLDALTRKKSDLLAREKKDLQKDITSTWKEIGGKEGDGMGPNGELASLADKCFDVLAGKYTYEVCVFGGAKQKEGVSGGTSLGTWSKMEVDEETGQRIMYWERGQSCWNGPQRSATAYVSCGTETKVLSADEPDTCRYVLAMESPIACDDAFRKHTGL